VYRFMVLEQLAEIGAEADSDPAGFIGPFPIHAFSTAPTGNVPCARLPSQSTDTLYALQ